MTIHALLVGINQYHPESGVSSLNGCENDVRAMEAWLKKRFVDGQRNITTLINETATRQNVIDAFKKNLAGKDVQTGDVVLFFYSGHGSYGPSAPEFAALREDTKELDETLVLYDSRLPGNFDLSDKELALLLAAVNQDAIIVVILDCCHSGSATRGMADEIKSGLPRFTPASKKVITRSLQQYVSMGELDYSKMKPLKIPSSKHILLAACAREELAYEAAEPNGAFAAALLKVLEQSPSDISYSRLHQYVHTQIKHQVRRQTPQIKVYDDFNPNMIFLSNEKSAGKPAYTARFNGQDWVLNYGVLQGMPARSDLLADIKVALYNKGESVQPVGMATIVKTGLNETLLLVEGLDRNEIFDAEILNHIPSLYICVLGDEQEVEKFWAIHEEMTGGNGTLVFHRDSGSYYDTKLEIANGEIRIIDGKTKKLLHGIRGVDKYKVQYIKNALLQVGKWRSLAALNHNQTDIRDSEIEFKLQIRDVSGNWVDCTAADVTLDLTKENPEIPFRIHLGSISPIPYYVAIYRLSPLFAIEKYTTDTDASILTPDKVPKIECNTLPGEEPYTFVLDPENNEETEIYKLVVSTEVFDDYFIEENRELEARVLDQLPGTFKGVKKASKKADWMIKTITVRLVRQLQQVDLDHGFSNQVLSIQPHTGFKASVALTPLDSAAKGYNPLAVLKDVFSDEGFSFMNLAPATKGIDSISQSVIELTGIEGEDSLAIDPLKMSLRHNLQEHEEVLALTISDGVIMPLGLLEKSENSDDHTFYLYEAPATTDLRREAGKNVVRALWFCFLKVVLKKDDEVFKLRLVDYKNGRAEYLKADLHEGLKDKTRILLVIHGIIGNTKSIAANLGFLVQEEQYPYDEIIAFDYENLNTSIEEIAGKLKEKLAEAGIFENKKIDILAHSMGGLVSRHFIEKMQGDQWVGRLFLVGVPNDGSAFGKLVTIRNWATGVLTVVCNYGKQFLGQFGPFLSAVNKVLSSTKHVTNTLEQMKSGSDFLNELNKSNGKVVSTKYFVLAGNTAHYMLTDETFGKKLLEKIKLAIGKLAYWSEENDIAVSVKSIRKVPASVLVKETEVGCHHMNYFDYDKSIAVLKEIMK